MPTSFWYAPSKHPFSVSLYRIAGLVWRIVPVRVAFVFIYLRLHKWLSHISSKDASGSLLSNPSSRRQVGARRLIARFFYGFRLQ